MDRCALFVDAGYALADGAMAVHGTRRRDSVSWDHAGLLKLLAGLARDRTGLPVLRCYWYETAAEGRRTAEHDSLAEMPGLKLRLVNALPGRREGIESQLRRDLVTLAKSGAICDAFIASANEHIAEIVAEVQDLGLRVVILHIASDSGWTIPLPLRQECDDIVEISGVHLRSYVDLIRGAEPAGPDEAYKSAPVGALTQHGLPAAALPAPAGVYQVHEAADRRQDSLSYGGHGGPGLADPRISAGYPVEQGIGGQGQHSAGPQYLTSPPAGAAGTAQSGSGSRSSASAAQGHAQGHAQAQEPSQAAQSQSAVNGAQLTGSSGPHAVPPYPAATGYPGSMGRQAEAGSYQNGYQGEVGSSYADNGAGGYQNGSSASYQGASASSGRDGAGQPGSAQSGNDQVGAARGGDMHGRSLHGGVAPGGDAQSAAQLGGAQHGGAQHGGAHSGGSQNGMQQPGTIHQNALPLNGMQPPSGVPQNGASRSAQPQSVFPNDPGLNSLASAGYQQQSAFQRGPGQGGVDQPGQNGTVSQNGVSYQAAGQNGTAQYGYPVGQPAPGQSAPGQQAPGQPGQQAPGQAAPGQPPQPLQPGTAGHPQNGLPQNGLSQASYQFGPSGVSQGNVRGSGAPGVFQPGGAQADPRSRDPYGSGLPSHSSGGSESAQPLAQGQYGYGASDAGFEQSQRSGFGQDLGAVAQPQFQPPQQSAAPLPAVRVQQPVAIALPDAVKAAHAEGFSFGESVGRDAPGLWLEAVLARKPRMPSDLEARLLQGSVLPIDSLLHDEVRHSLRRGFWDALESARR